MDDQMRAYKQNEQSLESRIQRTENEYQLEIRDLADKICTVERNANDERNHLCGQISQLEDEINKLNSINTSIETKLQAD